MRERRNGLRVVKIDKSEKSIKRVIWPESGEATIHLRQLAPKISTVSLRPPLGLANGGRVAKGRQSHRPWPEVLPVHLPLTAGGDL